MAPRASLLAVLGLVSAGLSTVRAVDSPSTYGKGDCLMENCAPIQSGYLDGYNFDPAIVGGSTFGQLWTTQTNAGENFLAQPITFTPSGGSQSVIAASEMNKVYVLDASTGALRTSRTLYAPFTAQDAQCNDVYPTIGITGTPVLDAASNTIYFWSKGYADGQTAGLANGRYRFYGVDAVTLQDKFPPVDLQGIQAGNRADEYFEGGKVLQRTGLLLANGVVYAGFGGHCDNFNYTGWIVGMDAASGKYVTSFSTQAGAFGKTGSGVWMAGGGLSYDGTNMWVCTGNGFGEELSSIPRVGRNPPGALAMSVVKLSMNPLASVDFFAPSDYRAIDAADQDFGSSGVAILPTGFAAGGVSRLAIANGKNAKAYVMNADSLGGYKTGKGGGDGNLQTIPLGGQSFSTAGAYPFEGGYVYISATNSPTIAYKFGTDSNGNPSFAQVGQTEDSATNRGVGHTTVTSFNGQAGSGLVWITDISNGNLRVYNALPSSNGTMKHIFVGSFPNGGAKYQRAVPGNGRMFMVSTSGYISAFGSPVNLPLTCTASLAYGTVLVGNSSTLPITCIANIQTTIAASRTSDSTFVTSAIPKNALAVNSTFTFNVTWTPTAVGTVAGTVTLNTTNGATKTPYVNTVPIILRGTATTSGPTFSLGPLNVAFGGLVPGAADSIGGLNKTVSLSNLGLGNLTVNSWDFDEVSGSSDDDDDDDDDAPSTPTNGDADGVLMDKKNTTGNFTLYSMPSIVAGQSSTALVVNFNPSVDGTYKAVLSIYTNGGNGTVLFTGNAAGPSQFNFSAGQYDGSYLNQTSYMDFGNVMNGAKVIQYLNVTNNGESALIISKSKPPVGPLFYAVNPATDLTEGDTIAPGVTESAAVELTPPVSQVNVPGFNTSGTWVLNGNDPNFGVHFINMTARIVSRQVGPKLATTSPGDTNGTARWQYYGCYRDVNGNATLPKQQSNTKTMENGQCQTVALAQNGVAIFAGTEYGQECWTGYAVPDPARLKSDEFCNTPCPGDSTQYCGASGYLSVFYDTLSYNATSKTLLPGAFPGSFNKASVGTYQYVDCVTDPPGRALQGATYTDTKNMTLESCVAFCSKKGFSMAGTEYAQECYCGNTLAASTTFNATGCTSMCSGDRTELCGGGSRLSLYALNGTISGGATTSSTTASATSTGVTTTSGTATTTTTVTGTTTSASASATSTGPPGLTADDTANYLGCYVDNTANRVFPQEALVSTTGMTISLCRSTCASQGYTTAGAEYGQECWCGNGLPTTAATAPDTDCSQPCTGSSAQSCGNSNRLSVYNASVPPSGSTTTSATSTTTTTSSAAATSTSAVPASANPAYKGCYSDSTGSRTLVNEALTGSTVTVETCRAACSNLGYQIAGVEYGSECWCGNSIRNGATPQVESGCNMPCAGNSAETCGGSSRLSIYSDAPDMTKIVASQPATIGNYTSQGCYVDNVGARVLYGLTPKVSKNTLENCAAACSAYNYFGVEYSNECYCGNTLRAGSVLANASDCSYLCAYNASEYCGGSSRMGVYQLTSLVIPATTTSSTTSAASTTSSATTSSTTSAAPTTTSTSTSSTTSSTTSTTSSSSSTSTTTTTSSTPTTTSTTTTSTTTTSTTSSMPTTTSTTSTTSSTPTTMSTTTSSTTTSSTTTSSTTTSSTTTSSTTTSSTTTSSTTTSTSAVSTALPSGVTSLGCYVDAGSRSLTVTAYTKNATNTPAGCAATCRAKGYRYSGVEYGNECYCDNFLLNSAANQGSGQSGCTTTCSGDSKQTCGGSSRIQIYKDTQWKQSLFTVTGNGLWRFSDCYVDTVNPRLLNVTMAPINQTIEGCLGACAAKNLPLCGVEYGGECYGAYVLPSSAKTAASVGDSNSLARGCNKPCNTNSTIACGGASRLNVYNFDSTRTPLFPSQLEYLS